jgi:parallel beta-helix repeat protein
MYGYFVLSAWSTIINIPADYPTIQQGIDASTDGDTVLVQPGTYYENINFNGHNIVLGSLYLTTGDTSYIGQTVIEGNYWWAVITFASGENSSSAIIGFTIQHVFGVLGGGVICINSQPRISNNIIKNNRMNSYNAYAAAGIYCENSEPLILQNQITNNEAINGGSGGICCLEANPSIIGNTISDNIGGGIFMYYSPSPLILNNVISNNTTTYAGCGIQCILSSPVIRNNLLIGNGGYTSGGIYINETSPRISNNIFRGNYPIQIYVWYGTPEIIYNNVQGGWPGTGNIDTDPLFRDPENGDFHLMYTICGDSLNSPCIDAGDPVIIDSLLDCDWGMGWYRSDMGAYGGGDSATVGIYDDLPSLPDRFILLQNYPNPFNDQTTIRFVLPKSQNVQLTIYDLLGRRIETLIDDYKQAGSHTITFDASHLSSGVYFYRLQAGEMVKIKRMVLLK